MQRSFVDAVWHCVLLLLLVSLSPLSLPQRTALSDDDIRSEVEALERQGHRRLLVLTGEHPKYTFDQFLHVSGVGAGGVGGAAGAHRAALVPPAAFVQSDQEPWSSEPLAQHQ